MSGISDGTCSAKKLTAGCSNIDDHDARDMPNWYNGMILCAKKEKDDSFINRAKLVAKDGNCPNNYKKCSLGDTSDINRVFCTSAEKCPINSLVVSQTSPGSNYGEFIPFSTVRGSGYFLYFSRSESNTLPIVDWKVSEEKVCLNNRNNYLSTQHQEYVLARNPRIRCPEIDDRFINVDSMSERAFFKANDFESITTMLPQYSLSSDIYWGLFFRRIIDFKVDCRYRIDYLKDSQSKANSIVKLIKIYTLVIYIFLGIWCLFYGLIAFLIKRRGHDEVFNDENAYKWNFALFLVNYVTRIISIGLSAGFLRKVYDFLELFEMIKGTNCSDDVTNQFFNNLYKELKNSSVADLYVVIFFNVGLICLDIFTILISYLLWVLQEKPDLCDCEMFGNNNFNFPKKKSTNKRVKKNHDANPEDIKIQIPKSSHSPEFLNKAPKKHSPSKKKKKCIDDEEFLFF